VVKINEYIESGILEAYVLGSASDAETSELLYLKTKHPEIQEALRHLETDLEYIAQQMAVTPPPGTWIKIEDNINELIKMREGEQLVIGEPPRREGNAGSRRKSQFIEIEAESGHMRIRKIWRWIFVAIFLLGKIFLAFAIYFYIENRHNEQELKELKMEMKNHGAR
jgi:hypothetical protein